MSLQVIFFKEIEKWNYWLIFYLNYVSMDKIKYFFGQFDMEQKIVSIFYQSLRTHLIY